MYYTLDNFCIGLNSKATKAITLKMKFHWSHVCVTLG